MLNQDTTDSTLINLVKDKQDSNALKELVERHTGIYVNIVNKAYINNNDKKDLIDNRFYNIYKCILDFDETRGAKFSTFLYNSTDWTCKRTVSQSVNLTNELDESLVSKLRNDYSAKDIGEFVGACLSEIKDKRFIDIFNYRHGTEKPLGWREIGKILGLSHEGVRKIYKLNIKEIRKKIQQEKFYEHKLSFSN